MAEIYSTIQQPDFPAIGGPGVGIGSHAAAHAAMGFNTYAAVYGVTGVNDGSRDDAPLLQAAYRAAISAGAKVLILPVGDVYIKSRTIDASYPYDYVIRNSVDNFVFVVPFGCTIWVTDAGPVSNYAAVFQLGDGRSVNNVTIFPVKNASIVGGGRFIHTLGYAVNNWGAAYAPASCDGAVIDNLRAEEFGSHNLAAFDSSSSFTGRLSNLRTHRCYKGVVQSSSASTCKHEIYNIRAIDSFFAGVLCSSWQNEIENIEIDNSAITALASSYGLGLVGNPGKTTGINIRIKGNAAVAGGAGLLMSNAAGTDTSRIDFKSLIIEGCETSISAQGVPNDITVNGFYFTGFTYGVWKTAVGSVHCKNFTLEHGTLDSAVSSNFGLLSGGGTGDVAEGLYFLNDVKIINVNTKYWNTGGVIATARNCNPMPTLTRPLLANNAGMPKGLEFWDNALTNPRYITYSGATTVWYDGAGASV